MGDGSLAENFTSTPDLAVLRREIDETDRQIIILLAQRAELAKQIEEKKRSEGIPILRPETEEEKLAQIAKWAEEQGVNPHFARSLFYQLIAESCRIQLEQRESNNEAR